MHCRQLGHLAKNCSKQAARNLPTVEAYEALIKFSSLLPESSKNETAVLLVPGRTTTSLNPRNPY